MFEEPGEAEQEDQEGPVNHILPQGVPEPNSVSTALRMVSNSSLENTLLEGESYNDLVEGPTSQQPLLQVQVYVQMLPTLGSTICTLRSIHQL